MALLPAKHARVKELHGGAIALNLDTGQYYTLNDTGARMWVLLAEHKSLEQVAEVIETENEVSTGADR